MRHLAVTPIDYVLNEIETQRLIKKYQKENVAKITHVKTFWGEEKIDRIGIHNKEHGNIIVEIVNATRAIFYSTYKPIIIK